jgi:hypothetical protein
LKDKQQKYIKKRNEIYGQPHINDNFYFGSKFYFFISLSQREMRETRLKTIRKDKAFNLAIFQ